MKYSLVALLALAAPALGAMYITNPVGSTSVTGGSSLDVEWEDDSSSPALSEWDAINIFIAIGSTDAQYKLAQIGTNVSTSKTSKSYTVPADLGADSDDYFIRMESSAQMSNGTAEYLAFSAKFTLSGMSGTFNSTVEAAISSASVSSSTATSSSKSSSSTSASSSTSKMTTSATTAASSSSTTKATSTASSSTSTASSGAAADLVAKNAVGAVGAIAAVAAAAVAML